MKMDNDGNAEDELRPEYEEGFWKDAVRGKYATEPVLDKYGDPRSKSVVFEKYKDIHLNEPAYVLGSGPTLNDFRVDDHPGIYFGVNDVYFLPQIENTLHYLLTDKYFPKLALLREDFPVFCKGWPGQEQWSGMSGKSNCFFYTRSKIEKELSDGVSLSGEIKVGEHRNGLGSIIFHGFFLALYTGCKKIHLVGCDCDADIGVDRPHHQQDYGETYETRIRGWEIVKEFVEEHHPDVEIISINPVNLKGMFKDERSAP